MTNDTRQKGKKNKKTEIKLPNNTGHVLSTSAGLYVMSCGETTYTFTSEEENNEKKGDQEH